MSLEVEGLPGEHGSVPGRCQVLPSTAPGKSPFLRLPGVSLVTLEGKAEVSRVSPSSTLEAILRPFSSLLE